MARRCFYSFHYKPDSGRASPFGSGRRVLRGALFLFPAPALGDGSRARPSRRGTVLCDV
jgi:hypothetical protein